jgi:Spy/CpxP family protein refolding chaperone
VKPGPRATGVLLLACSFLIGGLAGMAAEEALGLDWFDFLDEDATPADRRLFEELSLTPDQERRMEEIVERRDDRLEDYWDARLPEIRAIMDRSHAEMRGVLRAEQQPAFDRRVAEIGRSLPVDD